MPPPVDDQLGEERRFEPANLQGEPELLRFAINALFRDYLRHLYISVRRRGARGRRSCRCGGASEGRRWGGVRNSRSPFVPAESEGSPLGYVIKDSLVRLVG